MGSPDFVHEIVIIETQTVPLTKYMMDIAGVRTCPEDAKQETLSLQHLCFISPNLWLDSLNSLAFLHFSPSPPTLQKMDKMALAAFMPSTADPFFLLKKEIYIGTYSNKKPKTPQPTPVASWPSGEKKKTTTDPHHLPVIPSVGKVKLSDALVQNLAVGKVYRDHKGPVTGSLGTSKGTGPKWRDELWLVGCG